MKAESDVRAELLAAGERVFADRGYQAATVDDVIRASGTSRASFYRYFSGKEKLFDELSRACFREMRELIRALPPRRSHPADRATTVGTLERYSELNERYGGVIRAWSELTGPTDSPMYESGKAAVRAMFKEMEATLQAVDPEDVRHDEESPDPGGDRAIRAALLFLLIERSSFYVSNRVSRVDPRRLPPTLATLVHRGYLEGD